MLTHKLQNVIPALWIIMLLFCSEIWAKDEVVVPTEQSKTAEPASKKEALGDSKSFTNRLAKESSPYLLQHSDNPVDWYPWGEEAFDKARDENKPIFLSIGYSTCQWCQVMEDESFSNEEIAKLMNQNFINIKVDREELPEVERVYMRFVQQTTGSGGWPLSIWITPELKPFFGGTYFPPESVGKRPGLSQMLEAISELWVNEQENIQENTKEFHSMLTSNKLGNMEDSIPGNSVFEKAYNKFKEYFDPVSGGFGSAPKFPRSAELNFLLHYATLSTTPAEKKNDALEMVYKTINKIEAGAIHDQLGGGFHRYTSDRSWKIPHYEKMLYDQAAIASICMDAYQITNEELYKATAYRTLRYCLRRLAYPQGGFYTAEDAVSTSSWDSDELLEGQYYLWTYDEVATALTAEKKEKEKKAKKEFEVAIDYFNIKKEGNIPKQFDLQNKFAGKNALSHSEDLKAFYKKHRLRKSSGSKMLETIKSKLFTGQNKRPRPEVDDKIITAWNGQMIAVMARAYRVLENKLFLSSATATAKFIQKNVYDEDEEILYRSYRNNHSKIPGSLEDYAYLIYGLLELYEVGGDIGWLKWAIELQEIQDELFWDEDNGGYFTASKEQHKSIVFLKEEYDGALSSGISIATLNLLKLSKMLSKPEMREKAEIVIRLYKPILEEDPMAMPNLLSAFAVMASPPKQIVIAGNPEDENPKRIEELEEMIQSIYKFYIPNKVILHADSGRGQYFIGRRSPAVKDMKTIKGHPATYICEDFVCKKPTTSLKKLKSLLSMQ